LEIPAVEVLFAITPVMDANAPTLLSQTIRLPRSLRSAWGGRRGKEAQSRIGCVVGREHTGADIACGCDPRGRCEQDHGGDDGEQQHDGVGAGERAQLLRPAERRRPT
jgi:hypothetical protein